jgi:ketosteroid isomerase-like protein
VTATDEIHTLVENRTAAIRDKDLDRLMSLYVPDVVSYDLVPPLVYDGSQALRAIFEQWLGGFDSTVGMELTGLAVMVDGGIGYAHWLNRTSGTLRTGANVGYWARATICCRHVDGQWLISHEHLSLPVDFTTATAAMDLTPS